MGDIIAGWEIVDWLNLVVMAMGVMALRWLWRHPIWLVKGPYIVYRAFLLRALKWDRWSSDSDKEIILARIKRADQVVFPGEEANAETG